MPWLNETVTHRCAVPVPFPNYGVGSQWKCGDVGQNGCGLIYAVVFQGDAYVLSLMEPQPEPQEDAVKAPRAAVQTTSTAPRGLTLG